MRLVFAGTPDIAVPALEALATSARHEVIAVITNQDRPAGRGRAMHRSPVATWADEHGIEVLQPSNASAPEFIAQLEALKPDCCPIVAYGKLLRTAILNVPRLGWVNAHFSILPEWRGAAPIQASLAAGDDITGVTVFQLDEGMDTGPILGCSTEPIHLSDTSETLAKRLSHSAAELLVKTMDALEDGTIIPQIQPDTGATYSAKFSAEDAKIEWNLPSAIVDRRIRTFTPFPGPWTVLGDSRIKIGVPERETVNIDLAPGQIFTDKKRVLVGTATEALQLTIVQPQGKKAMSAVDWARGARLTGNEVLG